MYSEQKHLAKYSNVKHVFRKHSKSKKSWQNEYNND